MISSDQIDAITGTDLHTTDGDKIGHVEQIYLDDSTNQPAWLTVRTAHFGNHVSFVPLAAATWDGEALRVPYEKDFVKASPPVDSNAHLTGEMEVELYAYYGVEYGAPAAAPVDAPSEHAAPAAATAEHDDDSPDSMTRSEEQLSVGTEQREAGRVRLRKYIVTEQQTIQVPVSHEEVRLERVPISEADADGTYDSAAELGESEREIVLHEEVPVVTTQVRPVERVHLTTETVASTEDITADVRKEQIELEGDDQRS